MPPGKITINRVNKYNQIDNLSLGIDILSLLCIYRVDSYLVDAIDLRESAL